MSPHWYIHTEKSGAETLIFTGFIRTPVLTFTVRPLNTEVKKNGTSSGDDTRTRMLEAKEI